MFSKWCGSFSTAKGSIEVVAENGERILIRLDLRREACRGDGLTGLAHAYPGARPEGPTEFSQGDKPHLTSEPPWTAPQLRY